MEYRLLEKTELWLSPVEMNGADLSACAKAAARALGLGAEEIIVTDVLGDRLTLDVLVPTVRAEQIVAREGALLQALGEVPGVCITAATRVHSDGVLGLISLDPESGREILDRSKAIGSQVAERIRKRALVFSTGAEVLNGQIRDTNAPFLTEALRDEGFQATAGPTLEDRADSIARAFRLAAERGYGLVMTTGGIGAEGKDQTLEALERVDPRAHLPYYLRFRKGHGRHVREGVRIGVGSLAQTTFVCLPGPNDEVRLVWPVLRHGLKAGWEADRLAEELARALREKFMDRNPRHLAPSEGQRRTILDGHSGE